MLELMIFEFVKYYLSAKLLKVMYQWLFFCFVFLLTVVIKKTDYLEPVANLNLSVKKKKMEEKKKEKN